MAPARECCQWLTMMRQWMMRLDDSRARGHACVGAGSAAACGVLDLGSHPTVYAAEQPG